MLPIIVALLSFALPEPVVSEIPLDEVYGYNIPGTKPLFDLVGKYAYWNQLVNGLGTRVHAGPVLVMQGAPLQAAKNTALMLDGTYQPQRNFTEDREITLVVCSYLGGGHFVLDKIERAWKKIRISWHMRFTGDEGGGNCNIAVIPLGKCEPGDYDVDMVRTDHEFHPDWFVSKGTSFQVLEAEKPKKKRPVPGFAPNFSPKATK